MRGFSIGDRIVQPNYGTGTIRVIDQYHTVIDFDDHGIRRFATLMVKLEPSDTVEPGRPVKAPRKTRKKVQSA